MTLRSENVKLVLKVLEKVLLGGGLLFFALAAGVTLGGHMKQKSDARRFERIYAAAVEQPHIDTATWARSEAARTGIVGKVEIPSVGLSAIIVEGSGSRALLEGVGHLRGSAFPGEDGNVVLAGHRDTYFRSLKDVHPSDLVRITTASGVYLYAVDSTEVIDPGDTEVLRDTSDAVLTLVTCYPFHYVGHAPKRYVIQAEQVDAAPFSAPRLVRLGE
jgi:sortase A